MERKAGCSFSCTTTVDVQSHGGVSWHLSRRLGFEADVLAGGPGGRTPRAPPRGGSRVAPVVVASDARRVSPMWWYSLVQRGLRDLADHDQTGAAARSGLAARSDYDARAGRQTGELFRGY